LTTNEVMEGSSVPSKTMRGLPPAQSSIHSSKPMTVAPPFSRGKSHSTLIDVAWLSTSRTRGGGPGGLFVGISNSGEVSEG